MGGNAVQLLLMDQRVYGSTKQDEKLNLLHSWTEGITHCRVEKLVTLILVASCSACNSFYPLLHGENLFLHPSMWENFAIPTG